MIAGLLSDPILGVFDVLSGLIPFPLTPVALPGDERTHHTPAEWWRFVGHLAASDGSARPYAFEATAVRIGDPLLGIGLGVFAYFAFIDVRRRRYTAADRLGSPAACEATGDGFRLTLPAPDGVWTLRGAADRGGRTSYVLHLYAGGERIQLDAHERKPAVLHGAGGVVDLGAHARIHWYSRTRLAASGVVGDGIDDRPVTGVVWMDHGWGPPRLLGRRWKSFAIHLDGGDELLVHRVWRRGNDAPLATYATHVDAGGTPTRLDPTTLDVTDDGVPVLDGYPVHNRITAYGVLPLELLVVPYVVDQRRRARHPHALYPTWWEGACKVTGTLDGQPVTGRAFLELGGWVD